MLKKVLIKIRNLVIIVSLLIVIIISLSNQNRAFAQPLGWSDDVRLTNNTNNSVIPEIGIWKNNVHLFWCEQIPGPGSEYDLFYQRSPDSGKTWNNTIKLIDTPWHALGPSMAINRNTIHIVWEDHRLGGSAIFYMRSEDNGTTWVPEINISTPNAGTIFPDIAIWENKIYVVYPDYTYDDGGTDYQLYFIKSLDNGNTWSIPKRITSQIRDSTYSEISVNGSDIHVVWMDHYDKSGQSTAGAIFYMNSTDEGQTWSEDINLTPLSVDSDYPYIGVNGSMIHVVYSKEIAGLWQGYYRRSKDNGITWTDDIKIMDPPNDFQIESFAIENNKLYVVGREIFISDEEIYFVKSIDNGQNWDDDIRFTYYPEDSQAANIAVFNNTLHVAWHDYRDGNPEIYYKYYPFYLPPTNLTIDIWGTNLTLNWTTPQNGLSPVDYYLIYRVTDPDAFTFSDPEIIYNSSGTGNDLLTTWNDTTAFLDESNNYFYVVRAVYEDGEIDTNENIIGKYVIPLNYGWNLFSIPLSQNDTSISEVLKSINGNYNIVQWYDAENGIWRSSPSGLTKINRTMGLWIHMKNARNLSVVGALPESTDIVLYEGWNLVGYPSLKARNLNEALSGITWQAVQHYDAFDVNDHWKHNSTKKPDDLNDLKGMEPGRGYWVYITINDTWVRTRTFEDDKVVMWRVHGLEEKETNRPKYDTIFKNPIEMEEEGNYQIDIIPEEPTVKDNEDNFVISLIPLIILIAFVFAEIGYLYKRRR